ncbi:MAG: hypothetical protein K2Z81_19790 [Cyanobacteria bacterium]|nr:hypothetical protein [Cyanobacteriota bacterium]
MDNQEVRGLQNEDSSEPLRLSDFPDILSEIFDDLDTNRDNFVTQKELQDASLASSGNEQLVITFLHENVSTIEELSNDEWGDENSGITRKDIADLNSKISKANKPGQPAADIRLIDKINRLLPDRNIHDPRVFGRLLTTNFNRLDTNGDGEVSTSEVDETLSKSAKTDELHQLGVGLKANYNRLAALTEDDNQSVTLRDAQLFRYGVDPDFGFDKQLSAYRWGSYGKGVLAGGMAAGLGFSTFMLGSLAVADPEPLSKVVMGGGTAILGSLTLTSAAASAASFAEPTEYRRQYEQRRQMLESWSFFRE